MMLFAGYNYYPSGGMNDFKVHVSSSELDEKLAELKSEGYDWWHTSDGHGIQMSGRFTR